jgi:hypothetical protein
MPVNGPQGHRVGTKLPLLTSYLRIYSHFFLLPFLPPRILMDFQKRPSLQHAIILRSPAYDIIQGSINPPLPLPSPLPTHMLKAVAHGSDQHGLPSFYQSLRICIAVNFHCNRKATNINPNFEVKERKLSL